jgi:hypothetical protein
MSGHGSLSPYTQTSIQYSSNVKVEEDSYGVRTINYIHSSERLNLERLKPGGRSFHRDHVQPSHSSSNYSSSFSSYPDVESWQGYSYSSDRHATPLVR